MMNEVGCFVVFLSYICRKYAKIVTAGYLQVMLSTCLHAACNV